MSLKEYITKEPKDKVYNFYKKVISDPKEFTKISRIEMYNEIIKLYKEDPEVIIKLCSLEEVECLKNIINEKVYGKTSSYIEYIILTNLENNYLLIKSDNYYIPEDIINYIKMALNIYDKNNHSFADVTDSVIIGLTRVYNCIILEDFINLLAKLYINILAKDLKDYIKNNPKLKDKVGMVRYNKKEYVVSLENYFYKDILNLRKECYKYKEYSLENIISIGKYKINLFKEELTYFLNFLECHLEPKYIDMIINELVIYVGFNLDDKETLNIIADNITELYEELKKAIIHFPIWIYNGNSIDSLKENIIVPEKNGLCPCGSGKKYKKCCGKNL